MADFNAAAPTEPKKIGDYLHDRSRIPEGPARDNGLIARNWWGWVLGALLGFGMAAIGISLRDGWQSNRDWVIPLAALAGMVGGLFMGHLFARGRFDRLGVPFGFAFLALAFMLFAYWRGFHADGRDAAQRTLTAIGTVFFVISIVASVVAVIRVEKNDPVRPPEATL